MVMVMAMVKAMAMVKTMMETVMAMVMEIAAQETETGMGTETVMADNREVEFPKYIS